MINPTNGECSQIWRDWFEERMTQMREWLLQDATAYKHLPPSKECDPPRGLHKMAADWHIMRKSEVEINWDYEEYGAMMISDTMAYDGVKLYNPQNGRTWNNIVELLESEVKRDYAMSHPGSDEDVFTKNDGYFWSVLLQQWYDHCEVSLQ